MTTKCAIVLRLSLVIFAVSYGVSSNPIKRDSFSQHISRVRRFPCSQPQPRAVSSVDLMSKDGVLTYEQIIPAMTVLHRCDAGSGCCMQGTCNPEIESEVTLEFKIVHGMTGELRKKFVTVHNHTLCACSEGNHLPK